MGGPDGRTPGGTADQPDADPAAVARAIVLRQLTVAARSRSQLADKLAARQVPDDVATAVLDRFEQVGLVDDQAFAQGWVRSRHGARGLSRRAIAHELRGRGIDDEVAVAALAGVDTDSERRAARALVERRLRATRGLPAERRLARLAAMLARKGYGSGVAFAVVRQALADEAAATGDSADGADAAGDSDLSDLSDLTLPDD